MQGIPSRAAYLIGPYRSTIVRYLMVCIEKNVSFGDRGCLSVYVSVSWPSFICNLTFDTFCPAVPTFSHVESE